MTDDERERAHRAWGLDDTPGTWICVDSTGRRFIADTAEEARRMAEQYNHPRRGRCND